MKQHTLLIIGFLIFSIQLVSSQEVTIGLLSNPVIEAELRSNPDFPYKSVQTTDTINLPFFDDFSSYEIWPADTLWSDNYAFINKSFAVDAPSIGVATLDALDETGALHANANSNGFLADDLTSLPINLEGYDSTNSIFLSFYYQPQGFGDYPETYDSLYVEFFSPESSSWYWMWGVKGTQLHDFKAVIIEVPDTAKDGSSFMMKGFKFRFTNYASLTGLNEPSWASNSDQWHLDYVYLDTGRTSNDTILADLTFADIPNYLLADYTSMPFRHFKINAAQFYNTVDFSFYNYHPSSISVNRDIIIHDYGTNSDSTLYGGGGANYNNGYNFVQNQISQYVFPTQVPDETAKFKVITVIKPGTATNDFTPNNDTAYYIQEFNDYYAYDDGTPESGYGLSGTGTSNAMLAYKFRNYIVMDSLRGVDMYFNQTLGNASQQYFYLTIWDYDEVNDKPGNIIFSQLGVRPEYKDSLNQFTRYRLQTEDGKDTAIVTPDYFYIGWKQTTTDLLNVGLDKNNNQLIPILNGNNDTIDWRNPAILYNISGNWSYGSIPGALMIRPIFGAEALPNKVNMEVPELDLLVYPNPCSQTLNLEINDFNTTISFELFDLSGRILQTGEIYSQQSTIPVHDLTNGIYFLRLRTRDLRSTSVKFVVQH